MESELSLAPEQEVSSSEGKDKMEIILIMPYCAELHVCFSVFEALRYSLRTG